MSKRLFRVLAAGGAATIMSLAVGASAQDRTQPRDTQQTNYTFDDADEVVGDTASSQGLRVRIRLPNETRSLIRYRTHFRDSLLKSVEIL